MDLKHAILEAILDESKKLKKELDKKTIKEINKKKNQYSKLLDAVVLKEEYDSFINDEYTSYSDKDFKGKKILTDNQYKQLMCEWSKRVGEELFSTREESIRLKIDYLKKSRPNITNEELVAIENSIRNSYKILKQTQILNDELKENRKIQTKEINKMSKEERVEY